MGIMKERRVVKGSESSTPSRPDRIAHHQIFTEGVYIDPKLWKLDPSRLATDYVVTLGVPCIPSAHFGVPGADGKDKVHSSKPMAADHVDLLGRAERRIKGLMESHTKVHPRVLFLLPDSTEKFEGGNLHTFASIIKKIDTNRQCGTQKSPIKFHFIGHSSPTTGFGSMVLDTRMSPETLAGVVETLINKILPDTDTNPEHKKYITLIFETCNSAYFEYTVGMSDEAIKYALINESLIGKFAEALQQSGIDMQYVEVVGFRGFIEHYSSGELRVVNIATDLPHTPEEVHSIASDRAKYSITANRTGDLEAQIPKAPIYLDIHFPGAVVTPAVVADPPVHPPVSSSRDTLFSHREEKADAAPMPSQSPDLRQ